MEVILLESFNKLGKIGDVVNVKDGFARNYLIPQKKALFASEKNIKEVADALTDILYVTYGAGHAFGINLDKCFNEVQNTSAKNSKRTRAGRGRNRPNPNA